jgi:Holliday junction resolvase RusA-like endonuclease
MQLTLPIPPSTNSFWRVGRNGRVYTTDEARAYKETVGYLCLAQRTKPYAGNVAVTLRVFRKRKSGDADNFCKVLLDSLQGHAYINDKQVIEVHVYLGDDKDNPRVETTITEA